ncbi:MAG: C25 family cysteine peptidase [Candidatus Thermoplasmatota archaeon]|nr:C25 family cysteine peptidase [Candidatus Thermoplasmatota archaeon]
MKKNDKIIVALGVVILILASVGIYYYNPVQEGLTYADIKDFEDLTGNIKDIPSAITVTNINPFYPLIATPVAVHYNAECEQTVIPLFIENITEPSSSITNTKTLIGVLGEKVVDGSKSAKEVSLEFAEKYWNKSQAALIIEDTRNGYDLGIIATPLASYMSIPIIVTDEIDSDVIKVLGDLGVKKTIVCGEKLDGYGLTLKFNNVNEIVDFIIEFLNEKFQAKNPDYEIDYIALTNPIDAWPPEILDSVEFFLEERTISSSSMSQIISMGISMILGKTSTSWEFTIPKDYKYALIKFEGYNHDAENADTMGDSASFDIGPNLDYLPSSLQNFEVLAGGGTSSGGIALRDESGQIIKDKVYSENVVYDRGGVTYTVSARGSWLVKKQGTVSGHVIVEKLASPKYEFMKGLSAISPYLAAYHKGLVFGKEDFAFIADDDVLADDGKTCPGLFMPRRNVRLVPVSNRHIQDNIINPLNEVLAKIAGIDLVDSRDLKTLRDYYKESPAYIAIVSGAVGVPNYIYQNHVEPFGDIDGDGVDDTSYYVGGGTPSDVIYGNIDPVKYDWSNMAKDMFSNDDYPFVENIVGRITGWDSQDASALIARTVFYEDIVKNLDEWRDNFGLLIGGGQDFQKPTLRYIIFGDLLGITNRGEPMKLENGYSEMLGYRTVDQVVEPLGFNTQKAMFEAAMLRGLSDESLTQIKNANLLNKLLFSKAQVKKLAGEGAVYGKTIVESSNFLYLNGHGNQHLFGMAGSDLVAAGLGGPIIHWILGQTMVPILGGFMGPGGDLSKVGDYNTRSVVELELGPSFMWLESCICGKIDGIYPETNIGQAFMHAGLNALIASPTGSNIGGGYLEPKNRMYDNPIVTKLKYLKQKQGWKKGVYTEETSVPHFGFKIYTDLCENLRKNDVSIGLAFRNARNSYLEADANWELWWSPPLVLSASSALYKETSKEDPLKMEAKYVSYQEYLLFADPAFNPYEPVNEGQII